MKKMMKSMKAKAIQLYAKTTCILSDNQGEGYIDTVVILIAVVLGGSVARRIVRFVWRFSAPDPHQTQSGNV